MIKKKDEILGGKSVILVKIKNNVYIPPPKKKKNNSFRRPRGQICNIGKSLK